MHVSWHAFRDAIPASWASLCPPWHRVPHVHWAVVSVDLEGVRAVAVDRPLAAAVVAVVALAHAGVPGAARAGVGGVVRRAAVGAEHGPHDAVPAEPHLRVLHGRAGGAAGGVCFYPDYFFLPR